MACFFWLDIIHSDKGWVRCTRHNKCQNQSVSCPHGASIFFFCSRKNNSYLHHSGLFFYTTIRPINNNYTKHTAGENIPQAAYSRCQWIHARSFFIFLETGIILKWPFLWNGNWNLPRALYLCYSKYSNVWRFTFFTSEQL